MLEKIIDLTVSEKRTRKHWIIGFWLTIILGCVGLFSGEGSMSIGASFLGMFILYYCAYKKHGTGWLSFQLYVGIPLSLIAMIKDLIAVGDAISVCVYLVILGLQIYWYVLGFKLLDINKRFQKELNRCVHFNSVLENCSDLEELDKQYFRLIRRKPVIEQSLTEVYKKRKLELL